MNKNLNKQHFILFKMKMNLKLIRFSLVFKRQLDQLVIYRIYLVKTFREGAPPVIKLRLNMVHTLNFVLIYIFHIVLSY